MRLLVEALRPEPGVWVCIGGRGRESLLPRGVDLVGERGREDLAWKGDGGEEVTDALFLGRLRAESLTVGLGGDSILFRGMMVGWEEMGVEDEERCWDKRRESLEVLGEEDLEV